MHQNPKLNGYLIDNNLSQDFALNLDKIYRPLAKSIANKQAQFKRPLVLGLAGAQGTGKSTLAGLLALILQDEYSLSSAVISLDDYYLDKKEREKLAQTVHPLFKTRGVPGTHAVADGINNFADIIAGRKSNVFQFDKLTDKRLSATQKIEEVDIIIFEGWCVGVVAQNNEELYQPINDLETKYDTNKVWRNYVNQQLQNQYKKWFGHIDYLILLEVPDFKHVLDWRIKQERQAELKSAKQGLSDDEIKVFIQHFERLTLHMLNTKNDIADVILKLGDDQQVKELEIR